MKKNIATPSRRSATQRPRPTSRQRWTLPALGTTPPSSRAMNAFGKLLGEGTAVRGAGPSPEGQKSPSAGPRNAAQALFPNLPSSAILAPEWDERLTPR